MEPKRRRRHQKPTAEQLPVTYAGLIERARSLPMSQLGFESVYPGEKIMTQWCIRSAAQREIQRRWWVLLSEGRPPWKYDVNAFLKFVKPDWFAEDLREQLERKFPMSLVG